MPTVNLIWGSISEPAKSQFISHPDTPLRNHMNSLSQHTIQVVYSGQPTSCIYHLYGSVKLEPWSTPVFPDDFQDLTGPIDGTSVQMVHVVNKAVNTLVIGVDELTGVSATFHYLGNR